MTKDDQSRGRKLPAIPDARADANATDRFGLPLRWTLLSDSPARKEKLAALVAEVFATAVHHLGDEEARALFREVSKGNPGRRAGRQNADRDSAWLALYDARATGLSVKDRKGLVVDVARQLHLGAQSAHATEEATYRHLLGLVRDRDTKARKWAEAERPMRALLRRAGVASTLLTPRK